MVTRITCIAHSIAPTSQGSAGLASESKNSEGVAPTHRNGRLSDVPPVQWRSDPDQGLQGAWCPDATVAEWAAREQPQEGVAYTGPDEAEDQIWRQEWIDMELPGSGPMSTKGILLEDEDEELRKYVMEEQNVVFVGGTAVDITRYGLSASPTLSWSEVDQYLSSWVLPSVPEGKPTHPGKMDPDPPISDTAITGTHARNTPTPSIPHTGGRKETECNINVGVEKRPKDKAIDAEARGRSENRNKPEDGGAMSHPLRRMDPGTYLRSNFSEPSQTTLAERPVQRKAQETLPRLSSRDTLEGGDLFRGQSPTSVLGESERNTGPEARSRPMAEAETITGSLQRGDKSRNGVPHQNLVPARPIGEPGTLESQRAVLHTARASIVWPSVRETGKRRWEEWLDTATSQVVRQMDRVGEPRTYCSATRPFSKRRKVGLATCSGEGPGNGVQKPAMGDRM
jgi:hypothetical protein